jgi:Type IV secretion-system coupling protein DNA-binding domain
VSVTLEEAVTRSFYAWEVRGRGWTTAEYLVELEPPYRPCFLLPNLVPDPERRIDDARRPTIGSRLVDGVRGLFATTPTPPEPIDFEEQEPFPLQDRGPLTTLRIEVPEEVSHTKEFTEQLVTVLGAALHPVSFELVGTGGQVTVQLVLSSSDAGTVASHLEAFDPRLIVHEITDRLRDAWSRCAPARIVSFGLRDEFFIPLRSDEYAVDPLVPLVAALGAARTGECLTFQVLFTPTRNPWARAIREALDDGDGACLFEDAPWLTKAAEEKTETLLYGVVLRIAAQAESDARVSVLLCGTHGYLAQFESAGGNALTPLDEEGRDLGEVALLARASHRTGMLLSLRELTAFVHVPREEVQHGSFERPTAGAVPLPAKGRGHDLILGTHTYRGETTNATVDLESRFAHTWIIGGSGTGKSTLLARMILLDAEAGHGLAVLDPHGDLIDDVLARLPASRRDDVILFDPADTEYPVPLSVLGAASPLEENLIASDVVGIVRRLSTSWGDSMTTVLGQAVLAMLRMPEGASLVELRRFLVDERVRKEMLREIRDPEVRRFWEVEYKVIGSRSVGPLLTRLDSFLRTPLMRNILGRRRSPLRVGDCLDQGKILLCRLAKGQIGEENAYLLGSLLLSTLNRHALMRQAMPKAERRPAFIYADEFHHFISPSLESFVTETRKYHVGLVLPHQALAQVSDHKRMEGALYGSCHTRIVFRVGDEDASTLAKGFRHFDASALTSLGRGSAVMRLGDAASDFKIQTAPLPRVTEEEARSAIDAIRAASRARYAVVTEEVVALPVVAPDPAPISVPSPSPEPTAPVSAPRPRPKPPREAPTSGRGGQMHKYLQHLVKRLAEERGFRATIEGAAGAGQADVCLVRESLSVACEISVTTDVEHEIANLRKCVEHGFTHILCISPEKKIREALTKAAANHQSATVHVIAPEDIVTALDTFGASRTTETTVRGYKVKVTRRTVSDREGSRQRQALVKALTHTVTAIKP